VTVQECCYVMEVRLCMDVRRWWNGNVVMAWK
jgi:hypothetical protein